MRETCPKCDSELNDGPKCEQCGFVLETAAPEQTRFAAGDDRDFSIPDSEVDGSNESDTAHAPVSDESAAQPPSEDEPAPIDHEPPNTSGELSSLDREDFRETFDADDDVEFLEEIAGDYAGSARSESRTDITVNIGSQETDEKSLIEFTQFLPPAEPLLSEFDAHDLRKHVAALRDKRLVLINCPDEHLAYAAAHALINSLGHARLLRRLLNFDRNTAEGSQPSIFNLGEKTDVDTVVLVDAATGKARQFLEPVITAAPGSAIAIQEDLRQRNMYMICLMNLADLEEVTRFDNGVAWPAKEFNFPVWRVPFLRRLLQRYQVAQAEAIEARLDTQRTRGWWSPNDGNFYVELTTLLARPEQFMAEIERLDKISEPKSVTELFKGDDPLSDTVLYVATFFPNLTPYEFNQVVPLLLNAAAPGGAAKGLNEGAHPIDSPLLRDWHSFPDRVLRDCELATVPIRDEPKGVNFVNHSLRENLRRYLAREYNFFLENRFQDTQELGLLFSRSNRISEGAVQLCVQMTSSYPEYYGARWLESLVVDFEAALDGVPGPAPGVWRFIDEINPDRALARFYERLSQLIRAMLKEPEPGLNDVVEEFLQQLIATKRYSQVLQIVRRLQFVPAFDQFKWLKQLFHRGDTQIRNQTAEYLRGYLKRSGVRVHQVLSSLEGWLPAPNGDSPSYQMPAKYALQVVLKTFRESAEGFNARYFGAWPSAYPLLAFRDAEAAALNLPLLVRWLFHPGMKALFKDGVAVVNRVLTYWFFILRGKGERHESEETVARRSASEIDGSIVSRLLLLEISRIATEGQQIALLDYWREASREILEELSRQSYGNPNWERLSWKRDLIVELITSLTSSFLAARRVGIGV